VPLDASPHRISISIHPSISSFQLLVSLFVGLGGFSPPFTIERHPRQIKYNFVLPIFFQIGKLTRPYTKFDIQLKSFSFSNLFRPFLFDIFRSGFFLFWVELLIRVDGGHHN
jgi:hypothetical protein